MTGATHVPARPAHTPARPDWHCRACAAEWPCAARRRELRGLYPGDPVGLAVFLGAHLAEAAGDLPALPFATLMDRFVSWSRHPGN